MNTKRAKLTKNATIAIIAPAGVVTQKENIYRAKEYFESQGHKVVLGEHIFCQDRYMAGTDEQRLFDLHNAFRDKSIDAIICARGGYSSLRLINKIDYNLIKKNKKFFCGYSDITVLSAMFLKRSGLITYSGPMAIGDFGQKTLSTYTLENFYKVASTDEKVSYKSENIIRSGNAKGIMWGGNLASIVSLCGIDFIPNKDFIFFTEDINEPVYKIDKMMHQLLDIKEFRMKVKGIIFGDFIDRGYPQQINTLFEEIAKELNIPVLGGFKITHNKDKITIPYGDCGEIIHDTIVY